MEHRGVNPNHSEVLLESAIVGNHTEELIEQFIEQFIGGPDEQAVDTDA